MNVKAEKPKTGNGEFLQSSAEKIKAKQEYWNNLSEHYNRYVENCSLQTYITLAYHTKTQSADKVLEVGCGSGFHSKFLVKNLLKEGATLVSTDICPKMIDSFEDRFNNDLELSSSKFYKYQSLSTSPLNPEVPSSFQPQIYNLELNSNLEKGQQYHFSNESNQKTLNQTLSDQFQNRLKINDSDKQQLNPKMIFSLVANAESLPFPDSTFDSYLSNLTLMLVDNPEAQLKEAFRVLKGKTSTNTLTCQQEALNSPIYLQTPVCGSAGFAIWGRKENCKIFTIIDECLKTVLKEFRCESNEKYKEISAENTHSNGRDCFQMSSDLHKMRTLFEQVGFRNIKMWYQMSNYCFDTACTYYDYIKGLPKIKETLAKLDQKTQERFRDLLILEYEKITNANQSNIDQTNTKGDPNDQLQYLSFESLIIIAEKQ